MAESSIRLTVDGEVYDIRFSTLTARDARDFRAQVGLGLVEALTSGSFDLDVLAGLVWLKKRARNPGLLYEAVARSISLTSELSADVGEPGDEDTSSPEA